MAYKPTDVDPFVDTRWPDLLWLPMRPTTKKRPVVTRNGTYMPPDYVAWKEELATYLVEHGVAGAGIDHPVKLFVQFESNRIGMQLVPLHNAVRPKYLGTMDIDNMVGAVMDGLQDADVIDNDRLVYELESKVWI